MKLAREINVLFIQLSEIMRKEKVNYFLILNNIVILPFWVCEQICFQIIQKRSEFVEKKKNK